MITNIEYSLIILYFCSHPTICTESSTYLSSFQRSLWSSSFDVIIGMDLNKTSALLVPPLGVSYVGNLQQIIHLNWNDSFHQPLIFLLPETESSFSATFIELSKLLSNSYGRWKPCFFVFHPTVIPEERIIVVLQNMSKTHILPLDTDVYFVFNVSTRITPTTNLNNTIKTSAWVIWEVYNIKNTTFVKRRFHVMDSANNVPHGANLYYSILQKVSRRSNFEGVPIRAVAGVELDYVFETEFSRSGKSVTFACGMAVSFLRVLRDTLNFTEVAVEGEWMIFNLSNSLDWVVLQDRADIAISQSTLTLDPRKDTEAQLTYLPPTSSARLYAILVQPPASSIRDVFSSPFQPSLWLAIIMSIGVLAGLTLLLSRIQDKTGLEDIPSQEMAHDAVVWALGTLCQQGYWRDCPVTASMKALFMTAYTAGIICYTAYSAAIVSNLSQKVIPIKTSEDLKQSGLRVFADISNSIAPYMYENIKQNSEFYLTATDGAHTVLSKYPASTAFISFKDAFIAAARRENLTDDYLCETLSFVPYSRTEYKSSMFIKRGSPFREFFNYRITFMKERGLNRLYERNYTNLASPECYAPSTTEKRPLGLNDTFTAFGVMLGAFVLCSTFLLVEKISRFIQRPQLDVLSRVFVSSAIATPRGGQHETFGINIPCTRNNENYRNGRKRSNSL